MRLHIMVTAGLALAIGGALTACSSDSPGGNDNDASTSSGGSSAGGKAGSTSAGGSDADGGGSGGKSSTGGSAGKSSTGGSAGNASTGGHSSKDGGGPDGSAGDAATGSGGNAPTDAATDAATAIVPYGSCDKIACDKCFNSPSGGACAVIDNPCNDDSSCDPKENAWIRCICLANGDKTAQDACDATFNAVGSKASTVISCAQDSCTQCYGKGGDTCAVNAAPCQTCLETNCVSQIGACQGDGACKAQLSAIGDCTCNAQFGKGGTVAGCEAAFETAGGAAAKAVVECAKTCDVCRF